MSAALELAGASSPTAAIADIVKELRWNAAARVVAVESSAPVDGPVTAEAVVAALGSLHDRLMRDGTVWPSKNPDYMPLDKRSPTTVGFEAFFKPLMTAGPGDSKASESAAGFAALHDALKSRLTDIHVFLFDENPDRSDPITRSIVIIGKTRDGRLAGVLTGAADS